MQQIVLAVKYTNYSARFGAQISLLQIWSLKFHVTKYWNLSDDSLLPFCWPGSPHVWGTLSLKAEPPSLVVVIIHVAQTPPRQGQQVESISTIQNQETGIRHNLIHFLCSWSSIWNSLSTLNCNKSGFIPLSFPTQNKSAEVPQNFYPIPDSFGWFVVLSSRLHAHSTKTWRPALF